MALAQDIAVKHYTELDNEPEVARALSTATITNVTAPLELTIAPGRALAGMTITLIFLLLANLVATVLIFHFQYDDVYGLTRVFDFGAEKNIPTLFSSLGLILCASLLAIIAASNKRLGSSYLPWAGLATLFLFLAVDETASLHEKFTLPIRELLNTSGSLFFAWVIPYGASLVLLTLLYSRFLMRLPRKTMFLFCVSGATYVTGAIGLEMVGGLHAELYGESNLAYNLIVTGEEFLEMVGIVVFIYALLAYIVDRFMRLAIVVSAK